MQPNSQRFMRPRAPGGTGSSGTGDAIACAHRRLSVSAFEMEALGLTGFPCRSNKPIWRCAWLRLGIVGSARQTKKSRDVVLLTW